MRQDAVNYRQYISSANIIRGDTLIHNIMP